MSPRESGPRILVSFSLRFLKKTTWTMRVPSLSYLTLKISKLIPTGNLKVED